MKYQRDINIFINPPSSSLERCKTDKSTEGLLRRKKKGKDKTGKREDRMRKENEEENRRN